jgi:hypothetical protein
MIQRCGRRRFLFETPQALSIRSKRRRQNLDRYLAAQPQIARPVHFAHASGPEQALDLVVPQPRPFP